MSSKLLSRKRAKHHTSAAPTSASASSPESPMRDSSPSGSTTSASTPSDTSTIPQNVSDAFAQVHPSLVEYLSLFPTASLAVVDPAQQPYAPVPPAAPPVPPLPQYQQPEQMEGITATSAAAASYPHFYQQPPPLQTQQQPQQQQQQQPIAQEPLGYMHGDSLSALNMPDMGFTEDVLMSEHWMNLMRETGILDSNGNFTGGSNGDFLPQELMF